MNLMETPFYGDNIRWFLAKVINNVDPDMLGRVQIRIEGIHSIDQTEVPEYTLPWASVIVPGTEGGTSGIGKMPQLLPGALVWGFFLDGPTSQLPLVVGSLNQIETPTSVQANQVTTNPSLSDTSPGGNFGSDGAIIANEIKNIGKDESDINKKRLAAMIFFVDNGFSIAQSAGIVGNLEAESNFDTTVVASFAGESSQGIAQWNPAAAAGNRLGKLKTFANNIQSDWRNYDVQLQYVYHEMKGRPKKNDGGGSHAWVYNKLVNTTRFDGGVSNKNATWIICRYYENPANPEGKLAQREDYARKAYNQFVSYGVA